MSTALPLTKCPWNWHWRFSVTSIRLQLNFYFLIFFKSHAHKPRPQATPTSHALVFPSHHHLHVLHLFHCNVRLPMLSYIFVVFVFILDLVISVGLPPTHETQHADYQPHSKHCPISFFPPLAEWDIIIAGVLLLLLILVGHCMPVYSFMSLLFYLLLLLHNLSYIPSEFPIVFVGDWTECNHKS